MACTPAGGVLMGLVRSCGVEVWALTSAGFGEVWAPSLSSTVSLLMEVQSGEYSVGLQTQPRVT